MTKGRVGHKGFALALETSGAAGEVALARGPAVLEQIRFGRTRAHATELLPAVETVCRRRGAAPESIRCVYVSAGPGSFTGLRIGITAARMIALAHGANVVAVPTLEVIAQNACDLPDRPDEIAVLLDAKRKRAYAAAFRRVGDRYVAATEPAEVEPRAFLEARSIDCHVIGEGVLYHRDAVAASRRAILSEALFPPRVSTVVFLGYAKDCRGEFSEPRSLAPIYIRPPEAEEKWALRRAGEPS